MKGPRVGVWLIGARGSVATTAMVGLAALQRGLAEKVGLVSELPAFRGLRLPDWPQLVVGGHDVRSMALCETAATLARQQALDPALVARVRRDLLRMEKNLRPGTLLNVGGAIEELADGRLKRRRESPWQAVERLQADLRQFMTRHRLHQLVVVNVASTEPPLDPTDVPETWQGLHAALRRGKSYGLGASVLYAVAALDMGCAYINFTPSVGASLEAVGQLAELRGACHMGSDGKTGETLLKSALAPMFACRHLEVMSWVGHNIFGNLDGRVLDAPDNKRSKVASKDRLLREILGYSPQTLVSIEFIESLGDWKTAWDHIHFRGFLGTPMKLQFTWQGCDSLLAAPLVLDLVRFASLAMSHQERGLLPWLACFFKAPLGVTEGDLSQQFHMLLDKVAAWRRPVRRNDARP